MAHYFKNLAAQLLSFGYSKVNIELKMTPISEVLKAIVVHVSLTIPQSCISFPFSLQNKQEQM